MKHSFGRFLFPGCKDLKQGQSMIPHVDDAECLPMLSHPARDFGPVHRVRYSPVDRDTSKPVVERIGLRDNF